MFLKAAAAAAAAAAPAAAAAIALDEAFHCFVLKRKKKAQSGFTLNYPPALKVQMRPQLEKKSPHCCDQLSVEGGGGKAERQVCRKC